MVLWLNSTCCDVWRDLHKEVGGTVIQLHMLWCLKRSTQGSWWYCDWTPHAVMFEEIYTRKLMVLWLNSTCCDIWRDLHKEVGGTVIELHMLWCLKRSTQGSWWYCDWTPHVVMFEEIYTRSQYHQLPCVDLFKHHNMWSSITVPSTSLCRSLQTSQHVEFNHSTINFLV
jgi:hypothetical protein